MPTVVHSFDEPERFVAGTVGPPGQRTFFLQARQSGRMVSVALEKQQVAILAERLDMLLDEALRRTGGDASVPAVAPHGMEDSDPLDQPIDEEFRVGTITLGWDESARRAVIELFPVTDENLADDTADDSLAESAEDEADSVEDEVEAPEVVVVTLEPGYARAFVKRAQSVVSAGRPSCPFCGGPIDPEGHLCPRANGFKRTLG